MTNEIGQYDFLIIVEELSIIRLLTSYFESKGFKSYCVRTGVEGL